MKRFTLPKFRGPENQIALRGGSYSLMISAVVLAILIAINIFASSLPSRLTKIDISSSKLYSITSNTKVVVNALNQDVTIYWVVQSGEEDDVIENLLSKYDSLSEHIEIVKKNPDVFPTFTAQYTDETVRNNSLIVECGEKSRYIAIDDIYLGEVNMYTGTYNATDFDGEGAITSAIDYVVSEELPQLYLLEGHGEKELPAGLSEQIEKENMETNALSLLTADEFPENADCVVIYCPSSDISPEEKDMLADYTNQGGKLLVIAGPVEEGILENLYGLLEDYGVEAQEGIVVEEDREHYAFQAPYVLLPDMNSHAITDALIEENYYPIMPVSLGLTGTEDLNESRVTALLTTSHLAFSKRDGYSLSTYEREDGDIDGPFALAVSVSTAGEGNIVWFTSSQFLDEMYNTYSSGANMDLAMNALSSLIGESEAIAIRSKSLNYNYLTISDSTSSLLKVLMIGVFPLAYLGFGVWIVMRRRGSKMSRSKKLCVLLGLLAAVCSATLILLQVEEQKEKIKNSEEVILELPWESVTALSWEQDGKTLSFHKDETWLYDGDEAFPVSEERIQELLEQFEAFGVSFMIEDVEDYGQYGLEKPVCTIDLEAGEESWQIRLGDYSKMDSKRYVSIGDGNVYLVNNDPLDLFDTTLNSMIDNDDIPYWDRVTELRFEGEETYSAVYQENSGSAYSSEDVYFVRRDGKDTPLDTSRVESYLWLIRSMDLNNYVSYNAAEEELAQYGLDDPDLTVTVNYTAENEDGDEETGAFVLHISRDLETKQAAEQAERDGREEDEEEEPSTAYVRAGDSRIIYEISGDRYEELMAAFYDDLRHQEIFWADFNEVYQIDVSLEGTDHTITSEKDGDERAWSYQEEELDITDFQNALVSLRADSFTSEKPTGKEEIRFTLYLENENCPKVSVKLYRYDGELCLAEVDGKPVSLVRRSYAVDLIEAVQAIVLN